MTNDQPMDVLSTDFPLSRPQGNQRLYQCQQAYPPNQLDIADLQNRRLGDAAVMCARAWSQLCVKYKDFCLFKSIIYKLRLI